MLVVTVGKELVHAEGSNHKTGPVFERSGRFDDWHVSVQKHPTSYKRHDMERAQLVSLKLVVQVLLILLDHSVAVVQALKLFFPGIYAIVLSCHIICDLY